MAIQLSCFVADNWVEIIWINNNILTWKYCKHCMQGAGTGYGHIIYVIQQQDLNLFAFFWVIHRRLNFICTVSKHSVFSILIGW